MVLVFQFYLRELEEMCKNFNGDFIDLGKGGQLGMINPLEVIVDEDEEDLIDFNTFSCSNIKGIPRMFNPVMYVFISSFRFSSSSLRGIPLMFEQEKVLKSMLPIFPKQDIEDRIGTPIPSNTIAAMYPFVFDSIKDPGLSTLLG